ncbi:MAG: TPM domain-containing protein [Caulobacter sp.]
MSMTPADQDRIARAVAEAERRTAGEIYCVLAPRVSEYREVPLAWAAALALTLPALALLLGLAPDSLSAVFGGWSIGHGSTDQIVLGALAVYIVLQAVTFALVWLVVAIPPVRRFMTPGPLKAERVRRAALDQFLSHGLHLTRERTGVLIFAALHEHRAEVVADEGIYAAAPAEVWVEVVGLLTAGLRAGRAAEGFEAAIRRSGEILAAHVPPRSDNPNELSDRIVILEG